MSEISDFELQQWEKVGLQQRNSAQMPITGSRFAEFIAELRRLRAENERLKAQMEHAGGQSLLRNVIK